MKLFTIKPVINSLLLTICLMSCNDLNEEILDQTTAEGFFQTEEDFIVAIGSAYTSLFELMGHNGLMSINEIASDEVTLPQRGFEWNDNGVWVRIHQHDFNDGDDAINNAWKFCYGGINTCNKLIFQFQSLVNNGTVNQTDAEPFVSELKVLRALFYYWLLDCFGNVPVITDFDHPADSPPPTSSRRDVFSFVEQELLDNVPRLSKTVDQTTYGRMNFYVGQALLAKLYLNAEVYTGEPQWTEVIAACEVVEEGPFTLEPNYFTNFNANNASSKESIFVIPYDPQFVSGFAVHAMTLHAGSQRTFNLAFQPWNGYCSLEEFYNSYDTSDERKGIWGNQQIRGNFLAGPQFEADGTTPIIDEQYDDDPDGPEVVFTPEINELSPNGYRQAGARVGKYEIPPGSNRQPRHRLCCLSFCRYTYDESRSALAIK